jgi:hypothetical protein
MSLVKRLRYDWHCFWYCVNEKLLQDCLDVYEKTKIQQKVFYHQQKMLSL